MLGYVYDNNNATTGTCSNPPQEALTVTHLEQVCIVYQLVPCSPLFVTYHQCCLLDMFLIALVLGSGSRMTISGLWR
jgi:hypothetical protein